MIPLDDFRGSEIAVFGMGQTGLSAALALKAGGAYPIAGDDTEEGLERARAQGIVTADLLDVDWTRFVALVLSPGIPFTHPEPHPVVDAAQANGVPVISDIELFARAMGPKGQRSARIIGITGTNGKSTTTALIAHILQRAGFDARPCGNIGAPVLAMEPPGSNTVYVIELSSFQLDLTYTLAPDVAVLTNLSPDHLDRHGSMEAYATVKGRIFDGQQDGDMAVIGIDDDYSEALFEVVSQRAEDSHIAMVPVSVTRRLPVGLFVEDGILFDPENESEPVIADLRGLTALPGAHNWQNAALAAAAVRRLLPDTDHIQAGLSSFPGIAHRMETVARVDGIRFVNDSKATNGAAAARALACYDSVYWIAGGRAKDGGIEGLDAFFPRVRKAYLIGEAAEDFAETMNGKAPVIVMETLDRAVAAAFTDAARHGEDNAVVLFSPAAASFDQFSDFEARGDAFRSMVRALETARLRRQPGAAS